MKTLIDVNRSVPYRCHAQSVKQSGERWEGAEGGRQREREEGMEERREGEMREKKGREGGKAGEREGRRGRREGTKGSKGERGLREVRREEETVTAVPTFRPILLNCDSNPFLFLIFMYSCSQ